MGELKGHRTVHQRPALDTLPPNRWFKRTAGRCARWPRFAGPRRSTEKAALFDEMLFNIERDAADQFGEAVAQSGSPHFSGMWEPDALPVLAASHGWDHNVTVLDAASAARAADATEGVVPVGWGEDMFRFLRRAKDAGLGVVVFLH